MSIIKTFFNFLIFGKIIPGSKEQEIFEERATDENSVPIIRIILIYYIQ